MALVKTGTLDESMRKFDEALNALNQHVMDECKVEIEEFERARKNVEAKLRHVQNSDAVHELEETTHRCEEKLNRNMREVTRDIDRMRCEIEDDRTLDDATRKARLKALFDAARSEQQRLTKKYPAAMRAQMLHEVQRVLLH